MYSQKNSKHTTYIVNYQETFKRIIINKYYKMNRYSIDFFVAGYKYNDGKEIIELLSRNEPINLIREYFIGYDPFAIAVYDERCEIRLGYVPKIIAPLLTYKMEDENYKIRAIVKNVKLEEIDECKLEIRVFIERALKKAN